LYFSRDLKGYGWCFRKQDHLNVGFGSLDRRLLPQATSAFVSYLQSRGTIPSGAPWRWRGHAYLLSEPPTRRIVDEGVVLVGDAAGLAYPQSGEGIRPAIESGLMAAATILAAGDEPTRERLAPYDVAVRRRFGVAPASRLLSRAIPPPLAQAMAPPLFRSPWFVRHTLLDRWFLHRAA
jgi:flavin-dependent dehydrogenase